MRKLFMILLTLTMSCASDPTEPISTPTPIPTLSIVTMPISVQSGIVFSPVPTIKLIDVNGDIIHKDGVIVSVKTLGSGHLSGDTTSTTVDGTAIFPNLKISGTDNFTLVFTSPNTNSVTTNTIILVAGNPAALKFVTQPTTATAGIGTAIVIKIVDGAGNLVPQDSIPIVLSIGTNPSNGKFIGDSTQSSNKQGLINIGVNISKPGTGYTLIVTSPNLIPDTSIAFNVTPAVLIGISGYKGHNVGRTMAPFNSSYQYIPVFEWASGATPDSIPPVQWKAEGGIISIDGTYTTSDTMGYFPITVSTTDYKFTHTVWSWTFGTIGSADLLPLETSMFVNDTLNGDFLGATVSGGYINVNGNYIAGTVPGRYRIATTINGQPVIMQLVIMPRGEINILSINTGYYYNSGCQNNVECLLKIGATVSRPINTNISTTMWVDYNNSIGRNGINGQLDHVSLSQSYTDTGAFLPNTFWMTYAIQRGTVCTKIQTVPNELVDSTNGICRTIVISSRKFF